MTNLQCKQFLNAIALMLACVCVASANKDNLNFLKMNFNPDQRFGMEYFSNDNGFSENLNVSMDFMNLIKKGHGLGYSFYNEWQNVMETINPRAEGTTCFEQLSALVAGLGSNDMTSLKYFDSWGKIPAGVLQGHFIEFGNFDECVDLKKLLYNNTYVNGKYCFVDMPIGKILTPSAIGNLLTIDIGICMPAVCSAQEFDIYMKVYLKNLLNITLDNNTHLIDEARCSVRGRPPLKAADWFAISVLIILGIAMLLSSLYEFLCQAYGKNPHPLLSSFSVLSNMSQLLRVTNNVPSSNVIPCLNGIRCLSLIWVVFGHSYLLFLFSPNINAADIITWSRTAFSMLIQYAPFSVDSFFFLSGFLLTFIVLRDMDRHNGKLNVPMMYVHRILRLTPMLALAVLMYGTLFEYMTEGPLWPTVSKGNYVCKDTWWSTLLYVQNYVNAERMCVPHTWYLAVDTQLYIVSPIFLIALWKFQRKGVAFVVFIAMLFVACLFSIIMINKYSLHTGGVAVTSVEAMKKTYFITHARTSPWFVGLLFGYFMHKNKERRVVLPQVFVLIGWLICFTLIATLLFGFYPTVQRSGSTEAIGDAFYCSLSRVAWPLALCWIVFACVNGYGVGINGFLSCPFWQPFARLSYSIYLWHMLLINFHVGRLKVNTNFSDYDVMLSFWSNFGWSLLLSTLMYLACEAPFLNIEKFFLPKPSRSKTGSTVSNQNLLQSE